MTKSIYYDVNKKSCTTTFYDEVGNPLGSARSKLPNNDKAISKKVNWGFKTSVYTKSSQELYDGLTTKYDDRSFFKAAAGLVKMSARECVEVGWGQHTADFLGYAQVGYNKTPSGATKLSSYEQSAYSDFVEDKLEKTLKNSYGYYPEDIKGYNFSSNSSISSSISKDADMKKYVKNNIQSLLKGEVNPENTDGIAFKSDKDLYNSIHNAYVIDSQISGTTLTLNLFDIYDFDVNSTDTLNKTASAAMLDGKLIPYFATFEVKINLKDIFTDAELKELGLI